MNSPSITAAPVSSDGAAGQPEPVDPAVFVIFGATGDLARRKVIPALWQLHAHQLTARGLVILGVSRAELGEELGQLTPSPVVELNRAVAVAMALGPAQGLEIVDKLVSEPSLRSYHLLPSVRADFLFKLGRFAEAQNEFLRAASMTQNSRERDLLLSRAQKCDSTSAAN